MSIYFDKLQDHSEVKIEILNRYYIPWLRKINLGNYNSRKCIVIDGFAGKGIYDDGRLGSPLILIDGAIEFADQLTDRNEDQASITIVLVERKGKNFDTLVKNIEERYHISRSESNLAELSCTAVELVGYPSIRILVFNTGFEDFFTTLLDSVESNRTLIPSFCFVDPFGFSNTPFELFERFLKNEKSELLFNFMFEEINRFIKSNKNQKLIGTYQKLFGIGDIEDLRNSIGETKARERKQIVIDFYSRQLLSNTEAKFVLNFEFKKKGRSKMFLIYATKNLHGLKTMKDVMWKIDNTGAYLFDDKANAKQIEFDFSGPELREEMRQKLASLIYDNFKSLTDVPMQALEDFVLTETSFPTTNYFKQSLKILEKKGYINVDRKPGTNNGSFNEAKVRGINFMEHTFDM